MLLDAVFALRLIQLTGPDNQEIDLNPNEVVELREPRGRGDNAATHFHKNIKCLVFTSDGKFVGVTQDCATVRALLEGTELPP